MFAWVTPARAETSPEVLCTAGSDTNTGADDPALLTASRTAETMLATRSDREGSADRAIVMLSQAAGQARDQSAGALARFCATTGEAFRLGRMGNPSEARALLEDGFRHAEAARVPAVSALAAYRLALVSGGVAGSGTRGARQRRGLTPVANSGAAAADTGDEYCNALTKPVLDSGGYLNRDLIQWGDAVYSVGSVAYRVIALSCAINRARAAGDQLLAARASLALARAWLDHARRTPEAAQATRDTARQAALEGIESALGIADPALRVELSARLADAVLDAGAPDTRLLSLPAQLRAGAAGDPSLGAMVEGLAGRVALSEGRRGAAAADFRTAIFRESQASAPLRLADWYLLLAQAEPEQRGQHVAIAYRALNSVRPLLPAYDPLIEESNFSLRMRPVFEAMVDTSLATAPSDDDATRISLVQDVVESYRQAELQSLFGAECVAARPPIRPSELRPGEVLLYPILLPDRVELIYAAGGEAGSGGAGSGGAGAARYHRLPVARGVGRAEVLALIGRMLDLTSVPEDDRDAQPDGWRDAARQLYRLLIAPVEGKLDEGATLVIVPDGPLSALPFSALIDGQGRYLIQRAALAIVPSLAYAQPGGRTATRPEVVAATLEKRVDLPFGSYEALTGTAGEARAAIAAAGPGRGVLIENFHRADLVRALARRDVDVLHLATHASFNGRSDRSYIVADGELIPLADLREMIARSGMRGEQLDLVVLSACETAVGDDQASMGLAGAAVQAGARSAIASLWLADDAGTAALMTAFYGRYGAGDGKAVSLRRAQLAMIERGDDFADPYVWAAFTLLGGWR